MHNLIVNFLYYIALVAIKAWLLKNIYKYKSNATIFVVHFFYADKLNVGERIMKFEY